MGGIKGFQVGDRYGKWTVLVTDYEFQKSLMRCDCGAEKAVRRAEVNRGSSTSCFACAMANRPSGPHAVKAAHKRAYQCWQAIKQRCFNEKSHAYASYGGRGITMSPEWKASFENFLSDMGDPPDGMSIDRIDNDGNYEAGNCRWATARDQILNQRARGGASQYRGVSLQRGRKWRASLKVNGKSIYLGEFRTELTAALVYDAHASRYGHKTNFGTEVRHGIGR